MSRIPNSPEYITWLLTARCNLRCEHCYVSSRPWGGELSKKRVLKAVEEAREMGVKNLHLTGEPLLRDDVFEILAAAKNGVEASLFTNLTMVSRDKARSYARLKPMFSRAWRVRLRLHMRLYADLGPGKW